MTLLARGRATGVGFVRTVTALSVLLGPCLSARAQTGERVGERLRLAVQTPQSVAAIRLAPRAVLTAPETQLLPIEMVAAAGMEHLGVDPAQVELIEAVIEPPLGMTMYYGAAVRFAEPFDLERLAPRIWAHCEATDDAGKGVRYDSRDPNGPSFVMANERTLLVATPGMLKKLMERPKPKAEGPFADWVDGLDRSHDLHFAVNFEALRPFVQMGIAAEGDKIPEEVRPYLSTVDDLRFIEAGISIQPRQSWRLAVEMDDAAAADRLQRYFGEWRDQALAKFREGANQELSMDDPVQLAGRRWVERVSGVFADALTPEREETRFFIEMPNERSGPTSEMLSQTGTIGILVALLLPAVQAAREAARRNQALSQTKAITLAWHNFHDTYGAFPPQAITSDDGEPLLSWRVAILPYIEEQALYDEFRLDEPWDSPHNAALIPRMPTIYLDPSSGLSESDGRTHFLGVAGPGAVLTGGARGTKLMEVRDGTSATLVIVQVDDGHAVTWTQPADYDVEAHAANPLAGIGSLHPNVFLAGFGNGAARAISLEIAPDTLRAMMTIAGGERVELP